MKTKFQLGDIVYGGRYDHTTKGWVKVPVTINKISYNPTRYSFKETHAIYDVAEEKLELAPKFKIFLYHIEKAFRSLC